MIYFLSNAHKINSDSSLSQEDPSAHDKFVRLARAYETLKDSELRKRYDLYGEEDGKSGGSSQYHSWSFYRDNFGIYDDDPEIITLGRAEFGELRADEEQIDMLEFIF